MSNDKFWYKQFRQNYGRKIVILKCQLTCGFQLKIIEAIYLISEIAEQYNLLGQK